MVVVVQDEYRGRTHLEQYLKCIHRYPRGLVVWSSSTKTPSASTSYAHCGDKCGDNMVWGCASRRGPSLSLKISANISKRSDEEASNGIGSFQRRGLSLRLGHIGLGYDK